MVSTSRVSRGLKKNREEEVVAENGGGDVDVADYEESRAQRIKENAERMKSLGLLDLSKNLKVVTTKPQRKVKPAPSSSNNPPRRSSRLKDVPPVSYVVKKSPKKTRLVKNVEIYIEKGKNPEIYTEEHEKLLGDSTAVWDLYVDGFDEDGQRIYDPVEGKSCHQCRQKTLGLHTECITCKTGTGQFCGDCLYMRYGENVKEVNENPGWLCPVCRGICNCSRCRRDKGWMPTGAIYNRVSKLGFKSVAHYLIYTFRGQAIEGAGTYDLISALGSLPSDDGEDKSSTDALSMPSLGENMKSKGEKDDMKHDSDEDYIGDDYEEDDGTNGSSENESQ